MKNSDECFTISELLKLGSRLIRNSGIREARLDARVLFCSASNLEKEVLSAYPELIVKDEIAKIFMKYIDRRCKHEPVSKIIGKRSFWKLDLSVNSHVLDPRPESEIIIETVLQHVRDREFNFGILDLGTGSGALLLSILNELPYSFGVGTDCSQNALKLARTNAESNGLKERANFVVMDWARGLRGKFDIIVSNPPYIPSGELEKLPPEVLNFDPVIALDGGHEGLSKLKEILSLVPILLDEKGFCVVEFGSNQTKKLTKYVEDLGLTVNSVRQDLSRQDRCLVVSGGKNKHI